MADLVKFDSKNQGDILKWASENVVDGVINLAYSKENQAMVAAYFKYLINKAGGKTGDGRASKVGANLPKLIFDGKEWSSGLFRNRGGKGVTDASGFSFTDQASKLLEDETRVTNISDQTLQGIAQYDFDAKPDDVHAHHLRALYLYAPFFKGLKPEERVELARFAMEELNMPLGNLEGNLAELEPKVHNAIHRWMRANGIEVSKGKLPNLEGYNLEQMKEALSLYQEYVQKPVEDQLELIKNKVSLYEPTSSDLELMKTVGLNWDPNTGAFYKSGENRNIQSNNFGIGGNITEYSDNAPGGGWLSNLSNRFSIGPNYTHMKPPHLMKEVTSEMVRNKENWAGPLVHTGAEIGLTKVTGGTYPKIKTGIQTTVKLGKGDIKGATKNIVKEYVKDNIITEEILPLDQLRIGPGN